MAIERKEGLTKIIRDLNKIIKRDPKILLPYDRIPKKSQENYQKYREIMRTLIAYNNND